MSWWPWVHGIKDIMSWVLEIFRFTYFLQVKSSPDIILSLTKFDAFCTFSLHFIWSCKKEPGSSCKQLSSSSPLVRILIITEGNAAGKIHVLQVFFPWRWIWAAKKHECTHDIKECNLAVKNEKDAMELTADDWGLTFLARSFFPALRKTSL